MPRPDHIECSVAVFAGMLRDCFPRSGPHHAALVAALAAVDLITSAPSPFECDTAKELQTYRDLSASLRDLAQCFDGYVSERSS